MAADTAKQLRILAFMSLLMPLVAPSGCPEFSETTDVLERCRTDFQIFQQEIQLLHNPSSHCRTVREFLSGCTASIVGSCPPLKAPVEKMVTEATRIYIHQYFPELFQRQMAGICGDGFFDPVNVSCPDLSLKVLELLKCTKPRVHMAILLDRTEPEAYCAQTNDTIETCIRQVLTGCPTLMYTTLDYAKVMVGLDIQLNFLLGARPSAAIACGMKNLPILPDGQRQQKEADRCPFLPVRVRKIRECGPKLIRQLNEEKASPKVCRTLREYLSGCIGNYVKGCPELLRRLDRYIKVPVSLQKQLVKQCGLAATLIGVPAYLPGSTAASLLSLPTLVTTLMILQLLR